MKNSKHPHLSVVKTSSALNRLFSAVFIAALVLPLVFVAPIRSAKAGSIAPAPPFVSALAEPFLIAASDSSARVSLASAGYLASLFSFFTSAKTEEVEAESLPKESSDSDSGDSAPSVSPSSLEPPSPPPPGAIEYDFDNDGKADIGRWKSSTTEFKVKNSNSGSFTTTTIGTSASKPAPGDYDGDGITDAAVFNAGSWNIKRSSDGVTQTVSWGAAGDITVSGNYDNDNITDISVFRPSTGTWWIQKSTGGHIEYAYGLSTDIPMPGNYDGDSFTDYAVYRPSNGIWYIQASTAGAMYLNWGLSSDTPVHGDFDGDNKDDPAVYRPSDGTWYLLKSSTNYTSHTQQIWGNWGDQPAPADYDGDGKADMCIWRPSTGVWHTIKSSNASYDYQTLGISGDFAVPSAYTKQSGWSVAESTLAAARLNPRNATGGTNLYSQNFGWGTSLVGLPGRAGLDASFGIGYNSLVWTKDATTNTVIFDADDSNITPGFRFGFPVIEPSYYKSKALGWAYMMVTPSGGRVEFRQTAVSGTYETADSSYAQLVTSVPPNPNDPDVNITITVTTTDGTKMNYEWKGGAFRCSKVTDRNGNYITINHDDQGLLRTVTDTLGRVITVNYDTQLYPTTITQIWKDNNGQGTNTTHTYATFTYATQTVSTDFSGVTVWGPPNGTVIKVLDKITYANSSSTRFEYNGYLQVKKVRNFAADNHELNYVRTNLDSVSGSQTDCPRFTSTASWVENFNNNAEVVVTNTAPTSATYSLPGSITGTAAKVDVAVTGDPTAGLFSRSWIGNSGWQDGLPIATEDCINDCTGTNQKRWSWTNWTQDNTALTYILNPRVTESRVGDGTNTKRSTVSYHFDTASGTYLYGLSETVQDYDVDQTTVIKKSVTTYDLAPDYTNRRIIGLTSMTETWGKNDVTNSLEYVSKITYDYDEENFTHEPNQNISNVIQHDNTNYSASFVTGRGNLTSTTRHDVTGATAAVTAKIRYDIAGSVVAKLDPLNRKVAIDYVDSFNDTTTSRNTFAYPTTLTDPASNSSTVKYRFDFGANVRTQSPAPQGQSQGKITERIFDSIGRLQKDLIVNTGAYTRHEYPQNGIQSMVYSTIVDTNNNNTGDTSDEVLSESWSDGAGRVRRSRTEHPGSTGGYAGSMVEYDILGRAFRQTVPTEIDGSWNPAGDDYRGMNGSNYIWLWNSQGYDWRGRTVRTVPSDSNGSDGKDTLISYEGCGCAGGQVTTVQGPLVPRDDIPTQNSRRSQKAFADILGRTWKTENLNWTGGVYSTSVVQFNGRNQALTATMTGASTSASQVATLTYDGHGRLKTRHIPLQAANTSTVYNYNLDDSVQSVTDARGAATNVVYGDPRGLVTQINFTAPQGSTIPVPTNANFQYDNLGNRIQMTDGSGSTSYNYDSLSRLTSETRSFSGLTGNFNLAYEYSLSGELKKITDPSGAAINYGLDRIGRMNSVTGSGDLYSNVTNYASNFGYRAWGGLKSVDYGNSTSTSVTYNNRLQPTSYSVMGVRPYPTSNPLPEGGTFQYYNDGMLKYSTDSRTDISAGLGLHNRAFAYDHQGRMKEAYSFYQADNFVNGTTGGYPTVPFRHSYAYDAFGNTTSQTGTLWSVDDNVSNTFNSQNRNTTWSYDVDGRVITTNEPSPNGLTWSPVTFGYDAAGRQVSMTQTTSRPRFNNPQLIDTTVTTHNQTHDGNGVVAKSVFAEQFNSGTPTIGTGYYLRSSVTGKVIAEYDGAGTRTKASVYVRGQVLAQLLPQYPNTNLVFWEHLNPVTGDGLDTGTSGVASNRTAPNPDGVDVGDSDPFVLPGEEGGPFDPSQSAIDHMVAQLIPGWGGNCVAVVNGATVGCGWVEPLMSSGGFNAIGPDGREYSIENYGAGLYGYWEDRDGPSGVRRGPNGETIYYTTTITSFITIGDNGLIFDGGGPNTIAQLGDCLALSVPTFDRIDPRAANLLTNRYGDNAASTYHSWSIYERAVFLNTAVATADFGANLANASFVRFLESDKVGVNTMGQTLPYGIYISDFSGIKPGRHGKPVGSVEVEEDGNETHFDVDLFAPTWKDAFFAGPHSEEFRFNRSNQRPTHPGDVIHQLRQRNPNFNSGVNCINVIPDLRIRWYGNES